MIYSLEAEQSLLGAMLIDPRIIDDVVSVIAVGDFYRSDHQEIFSAIVELSNADQSVDAVTVSESLKSDDSLLAYVSTIAKNTPSTSNAMSYARIVRKDAKRRKIIEMCGDAIQGATQGEDSPEHIANTLGNSLDAAEVSTQESGAGMREIAHEALNELEARFNSKSELIGLTTGLRDLDTDTGGLCRGNLIVVAGRPSMGKTAFALNVIDKHLSDGGIGLFFSMEMSRTEIFNRQMAAKACVPLGQIRQPKTLGDNWSRLTASSGVLADYKLKIDDQAGLHFNQIRARARAYKRKMGGLDYVVIDYLTLMNLGNANDRVNAIGDITKGLKNMARDMDVAVILLSQLNRGLESRPNKRPVMSDLRDSGAIEQDADVIAFLYRDEVYNPDTEQKGICEIILAKQRNAAIGTVRAVFRGDVQRFENYAQAYK